MGKYFMILSDKNKMLLFNWNRTTKGALEAECCVTYVNDQMVAWPSPEHKYLSYAFTENRKKDAPWEAMVTLGFQRDESTNAVVMSTANTGDGLWRLTAKHPVTHVHFEVLSTNEAPPAGDIPQTLWVVMHCVDPGVEAYKEPSEEENAFNKIGTEA
jgi:hypothetical protein